MQAFVARPLPLGIDAFNQLVFLHEEGARALVRGWWGDHDRRFYAVAGWWPSFPNWYVGFRQVRRGLVVGEKIEFPRSYRELERLKVA